MSHISNKVLDSHASLLTKSSVISSVDANSDTLDSHASLFSVSNVKSPCNVVSNTLDLAKLWHTRMGHLSNSVLQILSNKIPFHLNAKSCSELCTVCPLAKQKRLPFISHNNVSNVTHDGFQYFLTIVDDHSRFTWIHLMKNKFDVPHLIKSFLAYAYTQLGKTIKCIHTDNANEFLLTDFLQKHGT